MDITNLKLISWNSRGFSEIKSKFISEYMTSETILCNQENFMLRQNAFKLSSPSSATHLVFVKPAIKENGGLFTAVPISLRNYFHDISPINWRIQALKYSSEEESFILINSYLPVDNRNNVNEVLQTLASINSIIEDHSPCQTIWTGDLNGDFTRSTPHAECLKSYIQEKGLHNLWDQFHVDYTCYYDEWNCSTIDHCSVKQKIVSAGNIVHPNNTSDHTPIYCELAINSVNEMQRNTDKLQSSKPL